MRGPAAVQGRGRAVAKRMRRRRRRQHAADAKATRRAARADVAVSCDEHPPVHRRVPPRALLLACFEFVLFFRSCVGEGFGMRGVSESAPRRTRERKKQRAEGVPATPSTTNKEKKTTDVEKPPTFPAAAKAPPRRDAPLFSARSIKGVKF